MAIVLQIADFGLLQQSFTKIDWNSQWLVMGIVSIFYTNLNFRYQWVKNQLFLTCISQNGVFKPYLKTSLNQAISLTEAMFMASSTVNYQLFYPFMKSTLGKNKSILGLIMTALCKLRYLCTLGSGIWLLNLLIFFPEAIFLFKWVHFWIFFSLGYLNIKGGYIYSCLLFLTNVKRLRLFHSLCQFRTLE